MSFISRQTVSETFFRTRARHAAMLPVVSKLKTISTFEEVASFAKLLRRSSFFFESSSSMGNFSPLEGSISIAGAGEGEGHGDGEAEYTSET